MQSGSARGLEQDGEGERLGDAAGRTRALAEPGEARRLLAEARLLERVGRLPEDLLALEEQRGRGGPVSAGHEAGGVHQRLARDERLHGARDARVLAPRALGVAARVVDRDRDLLDDVPPVDAVLVLELDRGEAP